MLTESFNTMTAQLAEAQRSAEESRRAIETTRAYLESILANLSAGVLAFDDRYRLRTANPSAAVILQQPLAELIGRAARRLGQARCRRSRRSPSSSPRASAPARDGQWQTRGGARASPITRARC